MDFYAAEAREQRHGGGRRAAMKVLVIALGLVLGAIVGAVAALYFGLVTITC